MKTEIKNDFSEQKQRIVGWKLTCLSGKGGKFKRRDKILGGSEYNFSFESDYSKGCHWKL